MVYLVSGANTVTFTLYEKITLSSPEYVLILVNDNSKLAVGCKLGSELSAYPSRFNQFVVTVKTSPVALNSEVNLLNAGEYHYYVLERADADVFNFNAIGDPDDFTGVVETGKLRYTITPESNEYYITQQSAVKVYGD